MKSSAVVKVKICTRHRSILGGCQGRLKAFILTLDSLPGSLTMERGNEAKRSSVELRSLVEGFGFLGSVSSVLRGSQWQPGNTALRAFLNCCVPASTKRLVRNLWGQTDSARPNHLFGQNFDHD